MTDSMVSAGFVGGGSRQRRHGAAQREPPDEPGQQEADDGDRGGEQKDRVPAGGDRGLEDVLNGVRQRHRGDHHRHEQQALLVADAPWTYCWNCGRNVMPPNMATRPRWWAWRGALRSHIPQYPPTQDPWVCRSPVRSAWGPCSRSTMAKSSSRWPLGTCRSAASITDSRACSSDPVRRSGHSEARSRNRPSVSRASLRPSVYISSRSPGDHGRVADT